VEPVIQTVGLVQGYGRQKILSGLNFAVPPGVLGLLGPNGAGKTTLLRTLATILPPISGSVIFDGEDIRSEAAARKARRRIGFLPQTFGFFPGFTVYDFVRYCAWLREVPGREAHRATVAAIETVGLVDRSGDKLKTLSGGMIRRLGIAQALVGGSRLLLLDEPTVGLDPAQRLEFREVVRNLGDVAVVLSTHLVEDVTAVCDEVAVLAAGRLVFRGTTDALVDAATPGAAGDNAIERGYMSVLAMSGTVA
jgi:ABC-2 type transport system ATP-binding protein